MEIAGASVCRGAELATRGMDSADVEPELPSAVQDLIRCLEGKADPSMQLRNLHRAEFQDFFPKTLRELTEWRRRVRKRVLEAIRSCKTFKYIDMKDIFRGDISRLEAEEWVFILEGFRSSTALRVIRVEGLTWTSIAEVEGFCLQVGKILKTSSVTHLSVGSCRLSATCFRNLATGLHGNSRSMLKSIELHNAWEDSSALEHVADIIKNATRLETLEIGGSADRMYDMDGEAAEILSQALILSLSLKTLVLKEAKGVLSALLLKALSGDDVNRSIECLHLISVSGLGDCLRELLSSNPFLKDVTLTNIDMGSEKWRQLGEAIRENATARSICVTHRRDDLKAAEELACAASPKDTTSSVGKDPTVELTITFTDYQALMSALNFVDRVLRGDIKSLKSLILVLKIEAGSCPSGSDEHSKNGGVTMEGKTETSVLESLKLFAQSKDIFKAVWKDLLPGLQGNTSLTRLDLSNSELDDEAFRDLMRLLQGNSALQEIIVSGTSWASDGKALQIHRALQNKNEKNKERAVYMSVFGEANLKFGDAKAGRLFLCGSPRAGKTQLRRTLMKIIRDKTWFSESLEKLSRTKGIEVDFLQNDDKMQISIWDLAGQWIFRTLQAVLFPQTNYFCVFLFVYSPFCEETSSPKPPSSFRTELEGWLTFISSSTKVMGHNLPQVLVVISHKDKMGSNSLDWVPSIVEDLKIRFANYVDLRPLYDFLYVNARKRNQVIPLKNHIFEMFKTLLSENSPRVPQLCFQLSSRLLSNIKKNKTCPLWSLNDFSTFCDSSLKQLILPSSVDHLRLLTSLLSYLNDVGSIICIPNLDHIIVDPNWLTNSVLGELIAMGQHFQARESKAYENTMPYNSYARKDGFMSEGDFALLIKTFLQKHPSLQDVGREVLEKIIFNLDLGFKLEDSFEYFIPSFIPEYASMKDKKQQEAAGVVSMSWDSKVANPKFFGMRIQCEDGKTMSLSAAFFPHFQVFMRRKLKSGTVRLSRHYLQLLLDGHQIYVEHHQNEKCQNYVDVLMLCSEHKSKEEAIKYVLKHVVQELISFCASPKGCPGVALVLGVIQTVCVEKLSPSHFRGAILIEELKSEFCTSINDKLGDIPLDRLQLVKEEELLNYEHTWPSIPALHLNATFEQATNLLWESEVEAVVNEIPQKHKQLESLQQSIISLNEDLAQSQPECEITISNSSLLHREDCNPDSASCSNQASTSSDTQLILSEIHSVHETVRSVKSIVQGLDVKLISLQKQLQSTFSDFMSKVDRMIKYSESHQKNKTPKRPYVTNDVGLFYKMSALLHVGTVVRLHLMCESVTGFHPVKGQEGLMLRLNKENSRWIPRVIEISYKVLYYAVKAGLDVTLGLGEAIPDWDDLKTDIVKLDNISENDRWAIQNNGHSVQLNEAWLRIQQILEPQLKYRYSEIFKLYKVKYKNGGHAWVCEECMGKGGLFEVNLTC